MKLITACLLLLALGVVVVGGHSDTTLPGAAPAISAESDIVAPPQGSDATTAPSVDQTSTMLTTVCAFLLVCCVLLISAVFSWRRIASPAVALATAPRGSPTRAAHPTVFLLRLPLSQLSISRT